MKMKAIGNVYNVEILSIDRKTFLNRNYVASRTTEAIQMGEELISSTWPDSGLRIGNVNLVAKDVEMKI